MILVSINFLIDKQFSWELIKRCLCQGKESALKATDNS